MPKGSRGRKSTAIDFPAQVAADIEEIAAINGFDSARAYLTSLHRKFRNSGDGFTPPPAIVRPKVHSEAPFGKIYHGDSLGLLYKVLEPNSVDLIVTSPPFGLVRQKNYGNKSADEYLIWFRDFAHGFKRVLKDTGSLVIDIGGAWNAGSPTRSLYQFKLLIMLCEEIGFHLAQDLYWWNPSRMPSPAAWVTVNRVRLTDSVNCVWWLSKTPNPKANNRNVLNPYKRGQLENIAKKLASPNQAAYNEGPRPSGHHVSSKWARDNKGSIAHSLVVAETPLHRVNGHGIEAPEEIPSNLFAQANTKSDDPYRKFCRDNNLEIHPAPFPASFPAFFIQMLTDPGDFVIDPFAGSCMTGAVARQLRRKWVCCELEEDYVKGGAFRVQQTNVFAPSHNPKPYSVFPSGMYKREQDTPLTKLLTLSAKKTKNLPRRRHTR